MSAQHDLLGMGPLLPDDFETQLVHGFPRWQYERMRDKHNDEMAIEDEFWDDDEDSEEDDE